MYKGVIHIKKIFSLFDDDGTLIREIAMNGNQLKEGWIVVYKRPLERLILECKEYSKVRVFIFLMSRQTFDSLVIISISEIAKKLKMNYKTAWACIKWLEERDYLRRVERDGVVGFMINPQVSTCGKKSLPEKQSVFGKFDISITKDDVPDNVDIETGEILEVSK